MITSCPKRNRNKFVGDIFLQSSNLACNSLLLLNVNALKFVLRIKWKIGNFINGLTNVGGHST